MINKFFSLLNRQNTVTLALAVFLFTFIAYTFITTRYIQNILPRGDGPHYLLVTQSLLKDRDIDLRNNYLNMDYKSYTPRKIPERSWHVSGSCKHEAAYPAHYIGLSVLFIPFFAWAGANGTIFLMNLLTAATIAVSFLAISRLINGNKFYPLISVLVLGLTLPFAAHATKLAPGIPAAFIIMLSFYLIVVIRSKFLIAGLLLAFLPWLHFKYVLVCLLLVLFLIIKKITKVDFVAMRNILKVAVPLSISIFLMGIYSNYFYGSFLPNTSLLESERLATYYSGIPYGLLGLFFDRKYGLLTYAPYFAIVPIGIVWYRLKKLPNFYTISSIIISFLLLHGWFKVWCGCWFSPTRYLVEVLPFLTIFIATALYYSKSYLTKLLYLIGGAFSFLIFVKASLEPKLLYMLAKEPHNKLLASLDISDRLIPNIIRHAFRDVTAVLLGGLIILAVTFFVIKFQLKSKVINRKRVR